MSKYNTKSTKARGSSPLKTAAVATGRTYEGHVGYAREDRANLFLRATGAFAGQDTFYEKAGVRDAKLAELAGKVAVNDFPWMQGFIPWLRNDGFMRSAPVLIAAEAVHARLAAGEYDGNAGLIDSAIKRADEPGEFLGYWQQNFGRNLPVSVKRGLAKAAKRVYSEKSLLKYDTDSHAIRFGDVLELTHPKVDGWKNDLFRYAIDRRHGHRDEERIPASLRTIANNRAVRDRVLAGRTELLLQSDILEGAGMTWEDALSLGGPDVSKAKLWTAMIPSMGYMALLRNLRNFEQAGIPEKMALQICEKLADPEEVAKAMQFPFRFYSAYKSVNSLMWHAALEKAVAASLSNIPALPGRNLVLIDTSGSMQTPLSEKSKIMAAEAAALFGAATGIRSHADIWQFASVAQKLAAPKPGHSILKYAGDIRIGAVGHGTQMREAIDIAFDGHDRMFIFSDMQAYPGYRAEDICTGLPGKTLVYSFNLNSYDHTPVAGSPGRHEMGGLSDATFKMIPLIERGYAAAWPWEV